MKALSTDSIQQNHHSIIIYLTHPASLLEQPMTPSTNFLVVNDSHLIKLELAGLAEIRISRNYAVLL
jgi:hypothetical protein